MELKVGDIAKLRFHRGEKRVTGFMGDGDEYVVVISKTTQMGYKQDYFWKLAKTVHRPTPEGLVQVWPTEEPK